MADRTLTIRPQDRYLRRPDPSKPSLTLNPQLWADALCCGKEGGWPRPSGRDSMACGQNSARWRCGGRIGVSVRVVPLLSSTYEGRGWPQRWARVSTPYVTFHGSVELNLCAGCCAAYRRPRRRTDAQHGVWHGDQGHSIAPSDAIRVGKGAWNVLSKEAEAGLVGPVVARTISDFYDRPYGHSSLTLLGHTAGVSASSKSTGPSTVHRTPSS